MNSKLEDVNIESAVPSVVMLISAMSSVRPLLAIDVQWLV